jgi:hypothetical protein
MRVLLHFRYRSLNTQPFVSLAVARLTRKSTTTAMYTHFKHPSVLVMDLAGEVADVERGVQLYSKKRKVIELWALL